MQSYVASSTNHEEARTPLRRFIRELLISLAATLIAGGVYAWQPGYEMPKAAAVPSPAYEVGWADGGYTNCQLPRHNPSSIYAPLTVRTRCG